ncbi:MAG: hypothetical protein ACLUD2_10255 [Clostridium sp.]
MMEFCWLRCRAEPRAGDWWRKSAFRGRPGAVRGSCAWRKRRQKLQIPWYFEHLPMQQFVPAAGQGILAVEIRQGELTEIMRAIHSVETEAETDCGAGISDYSWRRLQRTVRSTTAGWMRQKTSFPCM